MKAAGGVWHSSEAKPGPLMGFQLWIALPPEQENEPNESHYLLPSEVPTEDVARIILGKYGSAQSPIQSPKDINYLDVKLTAGESWEYKPPAGHNICWIAIAEGVVETTEIVEKGEMVIFEESENSILIKAKSESRLVLGSAVKHPYDLVTGNYSVHTRVKKH